MNTNYAQTEPSRAEVDAMAGATVVEFGTPWCGWCRAAQPLIAGVDYRDFKEFAAPRTTRTLVYGRDVGTIHDSVDVDAGCAGAGACYAIDPDASGPAPSFLLMNPDFNFRSLRGNAVLRWEYRPGSTLYLVWTQQRADVADVGDFDFARDRRALFSAHPDNVFLLKVSYWWGL